MSGLTVWDTNVIVEVSSAAPSADPVWVDISDYVIVPGGQPLETWLGRATDLSAPEPGRFKLILNNLDSRFTPGNASSPYYPWWKQWRRLRIRELVSWRAFTLADGYIQIPENLILSEVVGDSRAIAMFAVSGVDALGRAANSTPFISTLGAHVLSPTTPTPQLYYPLNEPAGSLSANDRSGLGGAQLTPLGSSVFGFATATGPPSDPLPVAGWTNTPSNTTGLVCALGGAPTMALSASATITVVAWVNTIDDSRAGEVFRWTDTAGANSIALIYHPDFRTFWASGGTSFNEGYPAVKSIGSGQVHMVSATYARSTYPVLQIGDGTALLGAIGGTIPSMNLDTLTVGSNTGDIGVSHLQVYDHSISAWTSAAHAAQYQVGTYALQRQYTGQRINTIADYAGIPAAARQIDPGTATLLGVDLAGATAAEAWAQAVTTEQGRLFVRDGRLVFQDRRTVYNV